MSSYHVPYRVEQLNEDTLPLYACWGNQYFTFFSALAISLRSVIAVEFIGVHHLTPAFVYLLVFQGTGAVIGPLVIGGLLRTK